MRPYQEECIEAINKHFLDGKKRQLISLPTGAGKTVIFAALIHRRKERALVLAGSIDLLRQTREKICMFYKDASVGLVDQAHKEFAANTVVASIQSASVTENLEHLVYQNFQLIVIDEAHHASAKSYVEVLKELGCFAPDGPLLVGFTATPFRSDSKGLKKIFDTVVFERNIRDMVYEGYLCKPEGIRIATDINFKDIATQNGDFTLGALQKVLNTPEMRQVVVDKYKQVALGKKAICFCTSVDHAKMLADVFCSKNINAQFISGEHTEQERMAIFKDFKDGKIDVLTNCNLLTEGFDEPSISCVIIARPTKSKGLYRQMIGRGLRLFPNKSSCLIIDFGDKTHTIVDTTVLLEFEEHESTVGKRKKTKSEIEKERSIPQGLNKKLKAILLQYDPLNDEFFWEREGLSYVIRGGLNHQSTVRVFPDDDGMYSAWFSSENARKCIAKNVSFEYGFTAAQDFVRQNRKLFTLNDKNAVWRKEPISEKQQSLLSGKGYKKGIDALTKGQASDLINQLFKKEKAEKQ